MLKKFKVLSLGYNCSIKLFLKQIGIEQETHFFDYIGSSMWAINELIENNFEDSLNLKYFKKMKILEEKESIITNSKYYLRFLHDFKLCAKKVNSKAFLGNTDTITKEFISKYTRRIERLINIFNGSQPIIFLRIEEPVNRIKYPQYADKFNNNELSYIINFSTLLKLKYSSLKFGIIFLSTTEETKSLNSSILILHMTEKEELVSVFMKFKEIIDSFLLKIN